MTYQHEYPEPVVPEQLPLEAAGPNAEHAYNFDVLREPDQIAQTLGIFQAGQLLVRGIEGPKVSSHGLTFYDVEDELGFMAEEGGMQHVSSTLIIPEEGVRVYKPFGFLMDSSGVEVEHVAEGDSLSSVDGSGNLMAIDSEVVSTLPELATFIRETHTKDMNEVNITLPEKALRGLFTINYDRQKLSALVTRDHIRSMGKGTLPLFVYDQKEGSLQHWEPAADETAALLQTLSNEWTRQEYARHLTLHDSLEVARRAGSTAVSTSV